MRLGLALYDPAFLAEDGSYWTWAHPLIDRKVLDALYYQVVRKSVPENESALREAELIGGFISVAEGHFYFRILDGGRDRQNRPGRFVILFGCSIGNDRPIVPEMVWRSSIFESIAAGAKRKCPVPAPSDLSIEFESGYAEADAELRRRLQVERRLLWKNDDFSEFMQLCGNLPTGEWKATIQLSPQQRQAELAAFRVQVGHSNTLTPSAEKQFAPGAVGLQNRTALINDTRRADWRRWVLVATLLMAVAPAAILLRYYFTRANTGESPGSTTQKTVESGSTTAITIHQITRTKQFEQDGSSPTIQKSMEIRFQVSPQLLEGDKIVGAEVEILAEDSKALAYEPVAAHATSKHRITVIDRQAGMAKVDVLYQKWLRDTFTLRLTLKSSGGDAIVIKSEACSVE